MAKLKEVYKCELCGHVVEILHEGAGTLVCCGQDMTLLEEKTEDSSTEKHVPFIEKIDGGYKVKVGENTTHPMTEEHYIEWIELIADGVVYRKHLKPNEAPEATFMVEATEVSAREYCNIHGLWVNEL
jgi:superoxide reductase